MKHNSIIKKSIVLGCVFGFLLLNSCKDEKQSKQGKGVEITVKSEPFFELSLAQWSIHKMILEQDVDPYTFAEKAKSWGFTGLEYVSGLYNKELGISNFSKEAMDLFVTKCNAESQKYGMKNLLIMIDGQGDLAATDENERHLAVENHYKWIDAAAAMGCHSIRVNLAGSTIPEEWIANSVDGLTKLATYAKNKNVNVIVENHGGLSSNAAKLAEIMEKVNMPNCGTLPDFGNFCLRRADGSFYNGPCAEEYDIYQGIAELMPFAKGVSAKSYNFDTSGNETKIDFAKMLHIVHDAGYKGFIGVEYEGDVLGETEGILATKQLLLKVAEGIK